MISFFGRWKNGLGRVELRPGFCQWAFVDLFVIYFFYSFCYFLVIGGFKPLISLYQLMVGYVSFVPIYTLCVPRLAKQSCKLLSNGSNLLVVR